MKLFSCQGCGQLLYFENIRCGNCGRALGYLPDLTEISALEPLAGEGWRVLAAPGRAYKFCRNYAYGVCNWMVPADDETGFCAACRHNRTIPDLSVPGNQMLWGRIEAAKHRLFYGLLRLGLPLESRAEEPERGLAFDFLADPPESHAAGVMTGHDNGLITLALKEADDAVRERVRGEMGEPYRTLLGHFRHESGHYFWDRLVEGDAGRLDHFRALFGDERADYAEALKRHYDEGAPPGWQDGHISAYAAMHPWEDFAETWAHYLHIVDTLETAAAFGLKVKPRRARGALAAAIDFDPYRAAGMDVLIDAWLPIEFATNSLNRSMGQGDLYPFVLSQQAILKLAFVHALTHAREALRQAG
ncbi:MAG TPA: putative zinc-binding peptidase [Rhizomicrobium sp.]|nr:putative zinc-binding peptidase [Rhizomicrobium sp.]